MGASAYFNCFTYATKPMLHAQFENAYLGEVLTGNNLHSET
jgi:hypothetical protein